MIKNDILIWRRDALSERINTSSSTIYFHCASIIWVEVDHVSGSGLTFSPGSSGVTGSAMMTLCERGISWQEIQTAWELLGTDGVFRSYSEKINDSENACVSKNCSLSNLNFFWVLSHLYLICTWNTRDVSFMGMQMCNYRLTIQFQYIFFYV